MAPMELRGAVQRDVPLLVVALAEEAAGIDDTFPVLITGMGKLRAGTAVTGLLLQSGPPSVVNNIGTAGALRPGLTGIHEIATVRQHDFDDAAFYAQLDSTSAPPCSSATTATMTLRCRVRSSRRETGSSPAGADVPRSRSAPTSSTWRATPSSPRAAVCASRYAW